MIWATSNLDEASAAAHRRACGCGDANLDHRPRVFEVVLDDAEPDPNGWGDASVMGPSGRVVRELELDFTCQQ
jgi:hypothetical protein